LIEAPTDGVALSQHHQLGRDPDVSPDCAPSTVE
jgi:hypothetical protein